MYKKPFELKEKILRYGLLLISSSFIVAGLYRNEVKTVFKKAINICLECIGIG
ncbi:CD1871A family CXXC motif-containing protein [Clostridium aestuarii]|uniref:CD1871A family CXXC motif-containing protein n=1 Tax=Clostridium aestuarii TaxID=338193 RepID=A0ABT4CYM4_9CLOT|nr:CD1871A family CXXC motif-containing protein [Clostridium aestuarii]MCY6483070.1 CD1871A family CXXC motif-containing protein [Clostridium aestuarii]